MKKLLAATLAFSLVAVATAQQTPATQAPASSGKHDWSRIQSLRAGTTVQIDSSTRHGSCTVKAVDADSLTCTSGTNPTVNRADVKSVKLNRRGLSALAGFGIGAAVGAIGGYVAAGPDTSGGGFNIISRGDVTVAFAVGVGFIGAIVGFFTHFASVTLYHR